jgi:hypothetical protein
MAGMIDQHLVRAEINPKAPPFSHVSSGHRASIVWIT